MSFVINDTRRKIARFKHRDSALLCTWSSSSSMNRRLRFLSDTVMSSRPSYRLGRSHPRRSFSSSVDRPHSGVAATADPQFHRHSQTGSSDVHRPASPHFNQNPNFRHRPPSPLPHFGYPNQQHRRPPPQFRPRPLDYRSWEFAKTTPSTSTDRFTVLSYNLLADYLALDHRNMLYYHIPRHMLDWQWRKKNLLFELGLWSTDIMCFQEVDRFQDLEEELKCRGYKGIWKMRTGEPIDGCAIFWRESRFKLLHEESIEFNKFGLRDNVAQICVLELVNQNCGSSAHRVTGSTDLSKVVVCNIHVLFNPRRGEVKLAQVRILLDRAHAVSKSWNDAPVILCGDLNCVPKSPLYNYILERKLDLSGLGRDMISGQVSAEIRLPRTYNPSFRSGENAVPASSMVHRTEDVIPNESSLGLQQRSDDSDGNLENVPSVENLSVSELHDAPNVYERSSTTVKDKEDEIKLDEVKEGTQQNSVDYVRDGEDLDMSHSDGVSSPSVGSYPVEVCSAEVAHTGIMNNPDLESFTDDSDTNNCLGKDSVNPNNPLSSSPEISRYTINDDVNQFSQKISRDDQGGFSGTSQANLPSTSSSIKGHGKLDSDGEVVEKEALGEDRTTFLSALHNNENAFPQHSSTIGEDFLSPEFKDPLDLGQNVYEPYSWSPDELEIATGSTDSTTLEHPLNLRSTYTETEDRLGIRDSNGEPLVTTYHKRFMGTVDYIWRSEGLETVRVLAPIPKHVMQETFGFPTKKWGSDHIALVTELALVRDPRKS